jgi:hypothetical protein
VINADDEQEVDRIGRADPAITSGMCTYDAGTMPVAVVPAYRDHGARRPAIGGGRQHRE